MAKLKKDVSETRICALLKCQREMLGLPQSEIAKRLHYRHTNFISMLENGASKIPVARIPAIVKAYKLNHMFVAIIIKQVYPELWVLIKETLNAVPELGYIVHARRDKDLDKIYEEALQEYRIM